MMGSVEIQNFMLEKYGRVPQKGYDRWLCFHLEESLLDIDLTQTVYEPSISFKYKILRHAHEAVDYGNSVQRDVKVLTELNQYLQSQNV